MSRGFAAANVTAAGADHVRIVDFAKLEFDSGTIYVHNGAGTIPWGGNDWLGAGRLLSMGVIEESNDAAATGFWIQLDAFDATILSDALTQEVYKRLVTVYVGFIGEDGALVADPHDNMWKGFMDTMPLTLGEASSIRLECELEVARDHVANGSLFTDEDQQKRHSGDTGFEYLDQMMNGRWHWGPGGQAVTFGEPVVTHGIDATTALLREAMRQNR